MTATLYGRTVKANTITGLKRKASAVANGYFNPVDEMVVCCGPNNQESTYMRINRTMPNNTIVRGQWR